MTVKILMRDEKGNLVGKPISNKDTIPWPGLESVIYSLNNTPLDKRYGSIEISSEEIENNLAITCFKVLGQANLKGIKIKGWFSTHSSNFINGINLSDAKINQIYLGGIFGYTGFDREITPIIYDANVILTGTNCNELHLLENLQVIGDLKMNEMKIGICKIGYDSSPNFPRIHQDVDFSKTYIKELQWKKGAEIKGKLNIKGTVIEKCTLEDMDFYLKRGFKPIQYQIDKKTKLPYSFKNFLNKYAKLSE